MQKKIAVLPGDGIGPEVMEQALCVLKKIEDLYGHTFECTERPIGGAAIDQTGEPLPQGTLSTCEESDAILFGSVGGPKWDHLPAEKRPEVGALLPLRKHFDLFANIRPAGVMKDLADSSPLKREIIGDGFEYVVVRELTGDVYFGKKTGDNETFGADEMKYTRPEVERIARVAFEAAKKRRQKVTNVDKANVLNTSRFWRKVVEEVHRNEYPNIELDHLYIDNAAMQVLSRPHSFDVILTGNLFGDILSDESAQISGSIGMQGSASVNSRGFGLYEPMGGSAPDIAGKGIANPIAQIVCVAMMLETSFGLVDEAKCISSAIEKALQDGFRTGDIATFGESPVGTKQMGDAIIERMHPS
jgi:3-isopropylmalate dehydrogenase